MGELIWKCETKFKKLTWHALIGGCKTRVLHQLLIEFILKNKRSPTYGGRAHSKAYEATLIGSFILYDFMFSQSICPLATPKLKFGFLWM